MYGCEVTSNLKLNGFEGEGVQEVEIEHYEDGSSAFFITKNRDGNDVEITISFCPIQTNMLGYFLNWDRHNKV